MTRMASEFNAGRDKHKISLFNKYELLNMKTMRCRNQANLSPANNAPFDAAALPKDSSLLYLPRLQA